MKFQIYLDTAFGWRWRLKARNGKIMADSGEAYDSAGNARRAIKRLQRGIAQYVPVEVLSA